MTATDTEAMELWRAVCAAVVRSKPDDKDQAAAAIIAAKLDEYRARIEGELTARIAQEARRYAGFYEPASDGRNTFEMFADFVETCARQALEADHGA